MFLFLTAVRLHLTKVFDKTRLQGTFRIYPLPADGSEPPPRMLQNAPSNETIELKVRVYVIKAKDLQPQDPNGFVSKSEQVSVI